MPWLKYELCHAWGYSEPEYLEFVDDVDEAMEEIRAQTDMLRSPRFEILHELPIDVLQRKIGEAEAAAKGWARQVDRLRAQLALRQSS